jgi:hypothetical protein
MLIIVVSIIDPWAKVGFDGTCPACHLLDQDEAIDVRSLCCVCVRLSERANECLAAVAGTHASADLAGGGA